MPGSLPSLAAAASIRPSRLAALLALLAFLLTSPPVPDARALVPPGPDAPVLSYVLRLESPSLHQRWLDLGGSPAGSAPESRKRAERFRTELGRAEARIRVEQDRAAARIEAIGARVVDRYEVLLNGLLVHATAAQMDHIASLPGLGSVQRAPLVRPHLDESRPRIGADRVAGELGYDGTGTTIAIIDAGIDYTHAHFGGPGSAAAYARAELAAERIDDEWQGVPLFPTDKVVGGWDFVGPNYTNPVHCSLEQEQAGRCRRSPDPDPDPLDQHGHGSHVAGIAAGQTTAGLASGIAPGARLVALKIYGPPGSGIYVDEEVDVVISALDWCARVNLGLVVEGLAPDSIDVVNMSLGEPWGQGAPLFEEAVAALVEQGVVVVASAGNTGDQPYVLGAPGAARGVLSVASTSIAGDRDQIVSSSSRGPSRHGRFGPSLAAPGASIDSASHGTGDRSRSLSGTSMAAPHAAGAAALLVQRNRAESLGLGALDLAALLMNTASPAVLQGSEVAPVSRQGAGRIDVAAAAESQLVARAGDIADLGLGFLPLVEDERRIEQRVGIRNLGPDEAFLMAEAVFHRESGGKGLRIELPDEPLRVPAGQEADLPVVFRLTADALQPWTLLDQGLDALQMNRLELDGQVRLRPVDAQGQPVEGRALGLPFRVLPRRASRMDAGIDAGNRPVLELSNGGQAGAVELFVLPEPPAGLPALDPDEPSAQYELDLAALGLRFESEPDGEPRLRFLVASHEAASAPGLTVTEIYLDSDDDGRDDWRLRHGALSGLSSGNPSSSMGVGLAAWDPEAFEIIGGEQMIPTEPVDLHGQLAGFALPLSRLEMDAPGPLRIGLVRRGLTEDWLRDPAGDQAPDGMLPPAGQRYRLDPEAWSHLPDAWRYELDGGADLVIPLQPRPGAEAASGLPRLLAVYPADAPEPWGRQFEPIEARQARLWLPMLLSGR